MTDKCRQIIKCWKLRSVLKKLSLKPMAGYIAGISEDCYANNSKKNFVDQLLRLLWLIPFGYFGWWVRNVSRCRRWFRTSACVIASFPGEAPETKTSISLTVVFSNALSGTLAYAKSNRIDYRSGIIFSLATAPGAIAGALTTPGISRAKFDLSFGLIMLCVAVYLTLNPGKKTAGQMHNVRWRFEPYSRRAETLCW
jgi:hypothetical protein